MLTNIHVPRSMSKYIVYCLIAASRTTHNNQNYDSLIISLQVATMSVDCTVVLVVQRSVQGSVQRSVQKLMEQCNSQTVFFLLNSKKK